MVFVCVQRRNTARVQSRYAKEKVLACVLLPYQSCLKRSCSKTGTVCLPSQKLNHAESRGTTAVSKQQQHAVG